MQIHSSLPCQASSLFSRSPTSLRARLGFFLFSASALVAASPAYAFITVGPDSDSACNFHDIQSAVTHAAQSPGGDLIALTSGTWSHQSTIVIDDSNDLTIEGGFASCSAGISTGRTELNGTGAQPAGSLIYHGGTSHLTVLNIDLAQATGGSGGGVDSEGPGQLTLGNVQFRADTADMGGGVFAAGPGPGNPHKRVELIGVAFISNTANGNGGGLYARDCDVVVRSNVIDNYFLENSTRGSLTDSGDGGAMYLADSNLDTSAHGIAGGPIGFMTQNTAARFGGGIFATVSETSDVQLVVGNDNATYPLRFTTNDAELGGFTYLKTTSSARLDMTLSNAIVENNTCADGVVFVDAGGASSVARLRMEQTPSDFSSAPPCAPGLECNAFRANVASNGDLVDLITNGGTPALEMVRARVRQNNAHERFVFGTSAAVTIDGTLVADNALHSGVVQNDAYYTSIVNSTFASNGYTAGVPAVQITSAPATLVLEHDLVVEAGHPVCDAAAGVDIHARDVGVGNVGTAGCLPLGADSNVQFLSDPFVNAAFGDFHIRRDSSAVDRWAAGADPEPKLDLDGVRRPQAVTAGTSTPYDFGAYEFQADTIFASGFDG